MTAVLQRRVGGRPTGRPGAVLACVCACTVLVIGFVASVNLAVPDLAASGLHPSSSQLLWILDAYVVLFACLVIPAGATGDRYGNKQVLLAGLLVFALGALVSAVAGTVPIMLVGRVICGVGAACVLPNALAVLLQATEPQRRPRAIAVWAAMSGAGGVVGNVGGGAVLQAGSWRWLFAAVAPLAIGCAAWAAVVTPHGARRDRRVDLASAALLTTATLALLVGIVQGPEQGWSSRVVIGAFVAATVLFLAWTMVGLRSRQPMLDPRLFAIPALRASCLGMLVTFFGMFGFFYVNASLLQYGRGFDVLRAGVGVVPVTVPLLLAARFVPALATRVGHQAVLAAAFVTTAAGLYGAATALDDGYVAYAAWLVVIGTGITLALPTLTVSISSSLPHEQAGVAGGLQATTREFGSALGVAVIGTLLTAGFSRHLGGGGAPSTVAEALARRPHDHDGIVSAYTAGADSALKVMALIVVAAGALVVADMSWAARTRAARAST